MSKNLQTKTLKPGLLVALKTSLRGNVSYESKEIEAEHDTPDGARKARWETERTVVDPEEHEAGIKARAKARNLISGACIHSAFGLLCAESNKDQLDKAIAEAREVERAFNDSASLTRLSVSILAGRIAADDVEAVKAINSEVRELLGRMEQGVKNCDRKVILEAAAEARDLGQILTPVAQERVLVAVEAVRKTARAIKKAGEQAVQEIDQSALRRITDARTSFLDLDEQKEIGTPIEQGRVIDLFPEKATA